MEKIMSHIHREQIKCAQKMQFMIEEDKVLNEQSTDIKKLLLEDGEVVIEEIHPGINYVHLRGKLRYQILYLTDDQDRILCKTAGEIGWEEKINIEGMEPTDEVSIKKQIEDMKVTCSNGRKLNIKVLVSLQAEVGGIWDEEIISELVRPGMEQKKEKITFSNLVVKRKELLRMKEETELPRTLPAIEQVLWKSLEINRWEIKPLEDNIVIGWEATMFVLYRSLQEESIRYFETTLKHNTNLECEGSRSGLWEKCKPQIDSYEINVKQDSDGEDRILEAEISFAPEILLYEEKETELITDIYGIQEEFIPVYRKGIAPKQEERQSVKLRLNKGIRVPASYPGILQVCHVKGGELSVEIIQDEEGSMLQGSLPIKILYQSEKEEEPYGSLREEISFQHRLTEAAEENKREYTVYGVVRQCNTVLLDREEIELKLTLMLDIQSMNNEEKEYLEAIEEKELSAEKRKELPTMAVYRAMEEEGLWEVGKRYFVPIENIKRINQLENDIIKSGQKILLVR